MRWFRSLFSISCFRGLLWIVAVWISGAGCESDDVGNACTADPTPIGAQPVEGENPVVEVVRVERDSACESFQCLRHQGLDPYCTRTCTFEKSSGKSCVQDSECSDQEYCLDGTCQDDDCPNGFWCRSVQEVGPLAEQQFCTRRTGCEKNLDCEAIGEVRCEDLGCFDACLLYASTPCDEETPCPYSLQCEADQCTCAFQQLACEPFETLPCECPPDVETCDDSALICQRDGVDANPWPDRSIERMGFCLTEGSES